MKKRTRIQREDDEPKTGKNGKEEEEASATSHDHVQDIKESSFFDLRTTKGQLLLLLVTLTIACLAQMLPINRLKELLHPLANECPTIQPLSIEKPTYWIYGSGSDGQWRHVNKVLQRLGFDRVTENESETASLLWAHDYPFTKLRHKITSMKAHQRVNHLPGCGHITNKIDLATTKMDFIPRAFKLPLQKKEFQTYAKQHPEKLFVVKHYQHRHIKIKKISEIDFTDNGTFIQEFIPNPLLVDGYKFDIGVYTIITSINPLRVYIYYGDILFRYCAQKYEPFDPENVDKYIVGDDYLPTWEVPSLTKFYNSLSYGMKGSFDAYAESKGIDPQKIWDQVEDAIRQAILKKEPLLNDVVKRYNNKQAFFEMARFDLIVDDDLKVWLMEANMSPNLSSAHFKQNFILYEQVMYHTLNLVGVGSYLNRESLKRRDHETEVMLSTDKNVMVNGRICGAPPCSESCAAVECQLCKPCLTQSDLFEMHRSYRQHLNKGETRRIFPIPVTDTTKPLEDDFFRSLSARNQMMTRWFHAKCLTDRNWCQ